MTSSNWTMEDVKWLRKMFGNNPTKEVALTLDRTEKSVERKACRLGLRKTKKYLRRVLKRKDV